MELPRPHRFSFGGHFESEKDFKDIYELTPIKDIILQVRHSIPGQITELPALGILSQLVLPFLELTLNNRTSLKITGSSFRLEGCSSEDQARATLRTLETLIPGVAFTELTELLVHYKYKVVNGLTFEQLREHLGGDRLIKLRYPNGFISIASNLTVIQTSSNRQTAQVMFDHFMNELGKI